jgi:ribokinase
VSDIVVFGSANADIVLRVVHPPAPGETVIATDAALRPGGKGANQAVAAARLGASVRFVGAVGDDPYGELLTGALVREGIDVALLSRVAGPTGTAIVTVTPDGENAIIVASGANEQAGVALGESAAQVLAGASVVVLQLEVPPPEVERVAQAAAGLGVRVVLNAAPAPDAPLDPRVLAASDPLVVNEGEARALLGPGDVPRSGAKPGLGELAQGLLRLGARSAIVTAGAQGSVVATGGGAVHALSTYDVAALDTTGAGDAFVGALAHRLAGGDGLVDAARHATAVAALAVTRPGAQDSYPTVEELGGFLDDRARSNGS